MYGWRKCKALSSDSRPVIYSVWRTRTLGSCSCKGLRNIVKRRQYRVTVPRRSVKLLRIVDRPGRCSSKGPEYSQSARSTALQAHQSRLSREEDLTDPEAENSAAVHPHALSGTETLCSTMANVNLLSMVRLTHPNLGESEQNARNILGGKRS